MGKNFKKFLAVLLTVSTVSSTVMPYSVYAEEGYTEATTEAMTEAKTKVETEGAKVEEEKETAAPDTEAKVKSETSKKETEVSTESKGEEVTESATEKETKKETEKVEETKSTETEVKKGKVAVKVSNAGGKVKVTGKNLQHEIAYVEGSAPYVVELVQGEVVHVEVTASEGYEVGTYRVLADSGAAVVDETIGVGNYNISRDVKVVDGMRSIQVSFRELPKETEETEVTTETATEENTEVATEDGTEKSTEVATDEETEEVTENISDTETEVVTEVATETVTEVDTEESTEDGTEVATEDATEEITEDTTEVETETEAVTEEATEPVTEVETDYIPEETEWQEDGYPIYGSVNKGYEVVWVRDTYLDLSKYSKYEGSTGVAVGSVPESLVEGEEFSVEYRVTIDSNPDYWWTDIVKYTVSADRDAATVKSDKCDLIFPFSLPKEGSELPLPSISGDILEGKSYTVVKGDKKFDLNALTNGYDVSKFRIDVENYEDFDIDTVGDYTIRYRVSYYLLGYLPWYVDSKISVVEDLEGNEINVNSDTIKVTYIDDDKSEIIDFGGKYRAGKDFTLKVEAFNTNILEEISPKVSVEYDGSEKDASDFVVEDESEGVYTFKVSFPLESGYTLNIVDDGNDSWYDAKGHSGGWSDIDSDFYSQIDGLDADLFDDIEKIASEDDNDVVTYNYTKSITVDGWAKSAKKYYYPSYGYSGYNGMYVKLKNDSDIQEVLNFEKNLPNPFSGDAEAKFERWLRNLTIFSNCHSSHNQAAWYVESMGSVWINGRPVSCGMNMFPFRITFEFKYRESDNTLSVVATADANPSRAGNFQEMKGSTTMTGDTGYTITVNKMIGNSAWASKWSRVMLICAFTLYDEDGEEVETLSLNVSDSDKSIASGTIEVPRAGKYKLVETDFCKGCAIRERSYEFELGPDNPTWSPKENSDEEGITGNWIINNPYRYRYQLLAKKDASTNAPLEGAVYKVEYSPRSNDFSDDAIEGTWYVKTDSDGALYLRDGYLASGYTSDPLPYLNGKDGDTALPVGILRFTEVKAPDGYVLDSTPFKVALRVPEDETSIVCGYNMPIKVNKQKTGTVKVVKTSARTGKATSIGGNSVDGAVFELFKTRADAEAQKNSVKTFSIQSGKAEFTIEPGTYYLREKAVPSGSDFVINTRIYTVTVKYGETSQVDVENHEKPRIRIHKTVKKNDFTNGYNNGYTLEGTRFGVYDSDGTLRRTLTIGSNGYSDWATLPAAGKYTVKEIAVTDGFVKCPDQTVTVSVDADLTVKGENEFKSATLSVKKYSSIPGITNNNAMYSFAGAEYSVYSDEACKKKVHTFVIKADGTSNAKELPCGTYYVKETKAPTNGSYKINSVVLPANLNSNGANVVKSFAGENGDTPKVTRLSGLIRKSTPYKTERSLAGAQFTVKFYAGKTSATGDYTRRWVFETDDAGRVLFTDDYRVGGNTLYKNENDLPCIPLGYITIEETKAPDGYTINTEVKGTPIVIDKSTGNPPSFSGTVVATYVETPEYGGVKVGKIDHHLKEGVSQGDATLSGAEFEIVVDDDDAMTLKDDDSKKFTKGQVIYTIKTNAKGVAQSPLILQSGKYIIRESKAPIGYKLSNYSKKFTIQSDGQLVDLSTEPVDEEVIMGGLYLKKVDAGTGTTETSGNASLAGAEFAIVNRSGAAVVVGGTTYTVGQVVKTIVTGVNGIASTGVDELPYGTYEVYEAKAPKGYTIDPKKSTVNITKAGSRVLVDYTYKDKIVSGDFEIQKIDKESNLEKFAQGDATLKGTKINVISENEGTVIIGGKTYSKGDVVITLVTDENGFAGTANGALPYGKYSYSEVSAPNGYKNSGSGLRGTFSIETDGEVVKRTYEAKNPVANDIIRGGFALTKVDLDSSKNTAQGDATLEGTQYDLYNKSKNSVLVDTDGDGKFETYNAGAKIATFYTDETGRIATSKSYLPYGTYEVREVKAPTGYLLDESDDTKSQGTVKTFSVRKEGDFFDYNGNKSPKNAVMRGGFKLSKVDIEVKEAGISQGDAVLSGAEFTLYNRSTGAVMVDADGDGKLEKYTVDAKIKVFVTDEKGEIASPEKFLPYGTYEVVETKSPEGYMTQNSENLSHTFSIRKDGEYLDLTNKPVANPVYRGDIEIIKFRTPSSQEVEDTKQDTLIAIEGVKFHIELVDKASLGKNHKTVELDIVTDKNGMATTASKEFPRGRLPYGEYLVTETYCPIEGLEAFEPFKVFIGRDSDGNYIDGLTYKGIYKGNVPIESPVSVIKVDAESDLTVGLPGTEWQILDKNKNVVVFDIRYPKPVKITNFVLTEEDNGIITLPEKLPYGTYYLHEVHAPNGYLLMDDVKFNVNKWANWEDAPVVVKGADKRVKGKVVITKYDSYSNEKISGAVFGVYAGEDIVTGDGVTQHVKDEMVDTITVGSDGKATSKELDLGKYYVRELKAPEGYYLEKDKTYSCELVYEDEATPIVYTYVDATNSPTEFKLYKYDIDEVSLEGIKFNITRIGGEASSGITNPKAVRGGDFVTDKDGYLDIRYLVSGLYRITEIETLPGYVLDNTPKYFAITSDGAIYVADANGNKVSEETPVNVVEMKWENDYTKVDFGKLDTKGNLIEGAEMVLLDKEGKEAYKWVSGSDLYRIVKVPVGVYTLREIKAPKGYTIASDVTVEVKNTGDVQKFTMTDKKVLASKVNVDGEMVVGAKLEVREVAMDGDYAVYGDVLDTWENDDTPHLVENLIVGHTYAMIEVEAPEGYVKAKPVVFTVADDKTDQEVTMIDIRMKANKYDETKKTYVEGAELEVQDLEGNVVDSWTTDGTFHYISGLEIGSSYVLVETKAPKGFAIALPINFTVNEVNEDQEVMMVNKKVLAYKVDTEIKELAGAELSVLDVDGNVVDHWVSDGTAHAIDGLKVGETYTLVEVKAPEGYAIASPITFKVEDNAKNDEINLINKKVFVHKSDITGEPELEGAKLTVLTLNGDTVDEWVSGSEPHPISNIKVGETYILREEIAPEGYVIASDVQFTVTDDKTNQTVQMLDKQVFVSKKSVTGDDELPGASLRVLDKETGEVVDEWVSTDSEHAISGLRVNKWYTLHEEIAPEGYVIANDIDFFVEDDYKIGHVEMRDKQVFMSKKSVTGEDELPGATISVIDSEGNVVDEWVSGTEEHPISGLKVGNTYTLHEEIAPEGYVIANDVEFTVLDDFQVQRVEMKDKQLFVTKKSVTGDDEITGANLKVVKGETSDGEVIDEWVSGTEPHPVSNLKVGETYTLVEVTAPKGYAIATSIVFTVEDDFQIQTVEMKDKIVAAHKVSADGAYVEGAKMEVRKYTEGDKYDVIDSWTTDGDVHNIENIIVGETYRLVEVETPEGWVLANPVDFTVEDDFQNQDVSMTDIRVKAYKYDETSETYVAGASLEVRDTEGTVVDSWVTEEDFHYISGLVAGGTYTLVETKAPKGFAIAKPVTFVVEDNGMDQMVTMINKKVVTSKVNTAVQMIEGAELEVRDKDGNVVDKWVSDGTPHEIENLVVGETYTLVETKAPEGYVIADPIEFTVDDNAKNDYFDLVNIQVFMSKKSVTGDDELPGAKITVYDAETNEKVDEWVSTTEEHAISGLRVNKSYIMEEITAPDGYAIAKPVKFFVTDNGNDQKVEMKDKKVFVSKVEIGGSDELEGAELTVTDKETGDIVDKWVSGSENHAVNGLVVGRTYTLTEVSAPKGYVRAESIEFEVLDDFKIQSVKMEDDYTKVTITKSDITDGTPVVGAELVIRDENGEEVDRWITGEEAHYIEKLPVGKYTLEETTAPDGYVRSEIVEFEVSETGEIQKVDMKDDYTKIEISKQDITTGEELPGAELVIKDADGKEIERWVSGEETHYIEKLPVGKYTLTETTAPDGYIRSEVVEFEVEETGEIQKVVMKDDYTKLQISKQDITTGKELAGAKLTILDSDGKVVESWTTTGKPYYIEKLPVGKYTLREETAPEGYLVAEEVEFEVEETGEIQKVAMKDKPKPTTPGTKKITQTGENTMVYVVSLIIALVALALVVVLVRKRRKINK